MISPTYIKEIASREKVELDRFLQSLLAGRTVVPSNRWVRKVRPCAVGEGLAVKVNANLGTSLDYQDPQDELEKLKAAVDAGADAVMDLSTGGSLDAVRELIVRNSPFAWGASPFTRRRLMPGSSGEHRGHDRGRHLPRRRSPLFLRYRLRHRTLRRDHAGAGGAQAKSPGGGHRQPGWLLSRGVDPPPRAGEPPLRAVRPPAGDNRQVRRDPVPGRRPAPRLHRRRHRRGPDQRTAGAGRAGAARPRGGRAVHGGGAPGTSPCTRWRPTSGWPRPWPTGRPSTCWARWSPTWLPATTISWRPSEGPWRPCPAPISSVT